MPILKPKGFRWHNGRGIQNSKLILQYVIPHFGAQRENYWNTAIKRGQSQARLNYAEQEQGKADFSRVNLSGKRTTIAGEENESH